MFSAAVDAPAHHTLPPTDNTLKTVLPPSPATLPAQPIPGIGNLPVVNV